MLRSRKAAELRISTLQQEQGALIKRLSAYQNEIEELQQRLLGLDELVEEEDEGFACYICGVDTRTTGSHYHCANCGRVSSMMGHYAKGPGEDDWSFTCEQRSREEWTD